MVQRIVCFKFQAGTSAEAIQAHMDHFRRLKDEIPQIVSYSGGLIAGDDRNTTDEYDSLHYATFASLEDIDIYHDHAAHQAFIEANKAIWEKVLVLNSTVD